MIVDAGADLNVYLETGEDGEKKGGWCAPATSAESCDDSGTAPAPDGTGCRVPAVVVPESTDLNRFVGK